MTRVIAGLTQVELAKKINRTQPLISMMEHGYIRPSKNIRIKLIAVLGLPSGVLFEDKDS
jgi:DNA-binding XRE family transcriptional regulator